MKSAIKILVASLFVVAGSSFALALEAPLQNYEFDSDRFFEEVEGVGA